jgi:transcriptional antiterminator RfaH
MPLTQFQHIRSNLQLKTYPFFFATWQIDNHATSMNGTPPRAWFCIRSQPKHEHIAAAHLVREGGIEVYLPRIRFQRTTRRGPSWCTEALFPNYLFAKFDWKNDLRRVTYSHGVSTVVHFGDRWPFVPEEVILDLQAALGPESLHIVNAEYEPGDQIEIVAGSFQGMRALVSRYYPSAQRVEVLLDFLGRQTAVQIPTDQIVKEGDARTGLFKDKI